VSEIKERLTDKLYQQAAEWQVNVGGIHIVAKRMAGRFRQWKWLAMLSWLPFFLLPYLRWNGQQALLFDIGQRQFHLFSVTLYPQDLWMLALILIFFAMLLALITSIAGRVFCGFFCFQTVWTDVFTLIEGQCEGKTPHKAREFNAQPWLGQKLLLKVIKHSAWLLIAGLTGIAFTAWFTDAFTLWQDLVTLTLAVPAVVSIITVAIGTYVLAGFMREQVCLWLCPYARLQSVMVDQETAMPQYDVKRGEPRGRIDREQQQENKGSCIDCNVCVAVCPTGIDIRDGQQQGCITCGLCIDACDSVMEKTEQPKGLIRYSSEQEMSQQTKKPHYKRPRVWLYGGVAMLALSGVVSGLMSLSPTEFNVIHQRQPLYVQLSNGDIQNRYEIKLFNKTQLPLQVELEISGVKTAKLKTPLFATLSPGKMTSVTAFVQVSQQALDNKMMPLTFTGTIEGLETQPLHYQSVFIGP